MADDVTATLTNVVSRGTGALARIGRISAGKTGTTQNSTDAWFIGYTPEVAAGVWIGFPTSTRPLTYPATPHTITGGSWPAVIWSRYAVSALAGVPYSDMPTLEGASLISVRIDPTSGAVIGGCAAHSSLTLTLAADPGEPEPCDDTPRMPQTVGLPAGDGIALMAELGVPISILWRPDVDQIPAGTIVGHDPGRGTPLDGVERIVVMVSGEPSVVPAMLGLSAEEARQLLRFTPVYLIVVVEASGDDLATGLVWKQTPPAGTQSAAAVTLWVQP